MKTISTFLFLAMVISVGQPSFACSCPDPPPVLEAVEEADAVFVARVTGMELEKSDSKIGELEIESAIVTLKVSESWKGVTSESAKVTTTWTCCLCGYPFYLGESFLVYARSTTNGYGVTACSRTKPAAKATEDIERIRESFEILYQSDD